MMVSVTVIAQSYPSILSQIGENNLRIKALINQRETEQMAHHTGNALPGPEAEFNYLWGDPTDIGNRKDISVSQSFAFPSTYVLRSRIASQNDAISMKRFYLERLEILLSAENVCHEIIYLNALLLEYKDRLATAEKTAKAWSRKLEAGETNIIESNKAQMDYHNVKNKVARLEAELLQQKNLLQAMNGDHPIDLTESTFTLVDLPDDFEEWYKVALTHSPLAILLNTEVRLCETQVKLSRSENLPSFKIGYASELAQDKYRGISVGASVPLWENKNKVKAAKLAVQAAQTSKEAKEAQLYADLKRLYDKATLLKQQALQYREALHTYDNAPYLTKALDAGQITLIDYLKECEYRYEMVEKALEAEKEYLMAYSELMSIMW